MGLKGRPPGCAVCVHADRTDIEQELANGHGLRYVAMLYHVPLRSLAKHRDTHMFTGELPSGTVMLSWVDILNIPVQMRERSEIVAHLIDQHIEPMMRTRAYGNSPAGLKGLNMQVLLELWKLQQRDEQTILKLTGVIRSDEDVSKADLVVTGQWKLINDEVDRRLHEIAKGNHELATQYQQDLAAHLLAEAPKRDDQNGHEAYQGWGSVTEGVEQ